MVDDQSEELPESADELLALLELERLEKDLYRGRNPSHANRRGSLFGGQVAAQALRAATLTTSRIFEGFLGAPERAFYYGHSFCGNPLGAAVAREVLRIYAEDKVVEGARARAPHIAKAFAEMADLPGVARTRALGMVGALDLAGAAGYLGGAGWAVYEEARRRGAYLRPLGNVVYVAPPLVISDPDLMLLLSIVRESVAAVATQ